METYWHWLCSVLAAEPGLQGKLLKRYKTPKAIFAAEAEELEEQFPRSRSRIGDLCRSRAGWDFEKEQRILRQKGIRFVSREHPDFPGRLLDIPDSPGGLFVKGRLPGEGAAVALVGARDCSAYGRNTALWFGRELAANGVQIISGMARELTARDSGAPFRAAGKPLPSWEAEWMSAIRCRTGSFICAWRRREGFSRRAPRERRLLNISSLCATA